MNGSVDGFSWQGDDGTLFRYPKQIVPPEGRTSLETPVLRVSGSADAQNWHEEVRAFLEMLKERHLTDWNQVAFLFRSVRWDKAKALASYLEEHGIPVYAPRSDLYFEREEVRLMIGALLFCSLFSEGYANNGKKASALWRSGIFMMPACSYLRKSCASRTTRS